MVLPNDCTIQFSPKLNLTEHFFPENEIEHDPSQGRRPWQVGLRWPSRTGLLLVLSRTLQNRYGRKRGGCAARRVEIEILETWSFKSDIFRTTLIGLCAIFSFNQSTVEYTRGKGTSLTPSCHPRVSPQGSLHIRHFPSPSKCHHPSICSNHELCGSALNFRPLAHDYLLHTKFL